MASNHYGLRKKEISGEMRLMRDDDIEVMPWQRFYNQKKKDSIMALWIDNLKNLNKVNNYWIHLKLDDYAISD